MDNDIFDIYGDLEEFDTNEELKNVSKNKMTCVLKRRVNAYEANTYLGTCFMEIIVILIIYVGQKNHRRPATPVKYLLKECNTIGT